MQPLAIVKHLNKLKYSGSCNLSGGKMLKVSQFGSQGAEKALDHGIIIRITFVAHAELDMMFFQESEIVVSGVLATPIGMVD